MNAPLEKSSDPTLALPTPDEKLIAMWVHGLSPHTRRYYFTGCHAVSRMYE